MSCGLEPRELSAPPPATWVHRVARCCVRPLLGTPVTPNHLTTLRLVSGLAAAATFAAGDQTWVQVGGALFVASAFLDRADGELARIQGITSRSGHLYDLAADAIVNAVVFVGIGVGLRAGPIGPWAIALGLAAGAAVGAIFLIIAYVETVPEAPNGVAPFAGRGGFDPDDSLFLIGPLAWSGLLWPLLVAAAIGAPLFAAGCIVVFRRRLFCAEAEASGLDAARPPR